MIAYDGVDNDILEQLGAKHKHSVEKWWVDSRRWGRTYQCVCGTKGFLPEMAILKREPRIHWEDEQDNGRQQ